MKNRLLVIVLGLLALLLVACSDDNESGEKVIPTMSLEVTDIADDIAIVKSEQLTGKTVSAKVVEYYPVGDIGFDYNIEVLLVKFVEENGKPVSLPYTSTIEQGLRPGVDYISAIIAYNDKGRAVCSAFQTWKAAGTAGTWTDDNSAGDLEENEW